MGTGSTDTDDVTWRIQLVFFHTSQDGGLKLGVVNITCFDLKKGGRGGGRGGRRLRRGSSTMQ